MTWISYPENVVKISGATWIYWYYEYFFFPACDFVLRNQKSSSFVKFSDPYISALGKSQTHELLINGLKIQIIKTVYYTKLFERKKKILRAPYRKISLNYFPFLKDFMFISRVQETNRHLDCLSNGFEPQFKLCLSLSLSLFLQYFLLIKKFEFQPNFIFKSIWTKSRRKNSWLCFFYQVCTLP